MSRWTQGVSPTNSCRKRAAVIAPACPPPTFLRSATSLLSVVAVLVDQRQLPERLAARRRRRDAARSTSGWSLPKSAGDCVAERDHAGAGQRREVDDRVGLAARRRRREHVGQHQAALGVGVQHLDRLAVRGSVRTSPGLLRACRRACSRSTATRRVTSIGGLEAARSRASRRARRRRRPCRTSSSPCRRPA